MNNYQEKTKDKNSENSYGKIREIAQKYNLDYNSLYDFLFEVTSKTDYALCYRCGRPFNATLKMTCKDKEDKIAYCQGCWEFVLFDEAKIITSYSAFDLVRLPDEIEEDNRKWQEIQKKVNKKLVEALKNGKIK